MRRRDAANSAVRHRFGDRKAVAAVAEPGRFAGNIELAVQLKRAIGTGQHSRDPNIDRDIRQADKRPGVRPHIGVQNLPKRLRQDQCDRAFRFVRPKHVLVDIDTTIGHFQRDFLGCGIARQ